MDGKLLELFELCAVGGPRNLVNACPMIGTIRVLVPKLIALKHLSISHHWHISEEHKNATIRNSEL